MLLRPHVLAKPNRRKVDGLCEFLPTCYVPTTMGIDCGVPMSNSIAAISGTSSENFKISTRHVSALSDSASREPDLVASRQSLVMMLRCHIENDFHAEIGWVEARPVLMALCPFALETRDARRAVEKSADSRGRNLSVRRSARLCCGATIDRRSTFAPEGIGAHYRLPHRWILNEARPPLARFQYG